MHPIQSLILKIRIGSNKKSDILRNCDETSLLSNSESLRRSIISIDKTLSNDHWTLFTLYQAKGLYPEAVEHFWQAYRLSHPEAEDRFIFQSAASYKPEVSGSLVDERPVILHEDDFFAGLQLLLGLGGLKDYKEAQELLYPIASAGHGHAQFLIAYMYHHRLGCEKNEIKAIYWYEKAAMAGNREAQFLLGYSFLRGSDNGFKYDKAWFWLFCAAEQSHTKAQFLLGSLYLNGMGIDKDEKRAIEWFEQAAQQGLIEAQYWLGLTHAQGENKNEEKSTHYFLMAAEQGYSRAEKLLASKFLYHLDNPNGLYAMIGWIRRAMKHAEVQYAALRQFTWLKQHSGEESYLSFVSAMATGDITVATTLILAQNQVTMRAWLSYEFRFARNDKAHVHCIERLIEAASALKQPQATLLGQEYRALYLLYFLIFSGNQLSPDSHSGETPLLTKRLIEANLRDCDNNTEDPTVVPSSSSPVASDALSARLYYPFFFSRAPISTVDNDALSAGNNAMSRNAH